MSCMNKIFTQKMSMTLCFIGIVYFLFQVRITDSKKVCLKFLQRAAPHHTTGGKSSSSRSAPMDNVSEIVQISANGMSVSVPHLVVQFMNNSCMFIAHQ